MIFLSLRSLFRHIKNTPELYGPILLVLFICGTGGWLSMRARRLQQAAVQTVAPGVTAVTVNDRALSTNEVIKYIADPKDKALITSLMAQLAKLKATTTSVVVSTAHSESTGSGRIITDAPPEATVTFVPAPGVATPSEPTLTAMHFKDYRLKFDADLVNRQATYTLTQQFETIVTSGRQKDGRPLALAQLYEIGENGERVLLPTVATTAVFADETAPHWMRKLAVQGGVALTRDASGQTAKGAVVAAQWLKRGRTPAAEDTLFAVLSPALVLGSGVTDIGLLPVSVNLGRLPHQPFTNVWLSPFVAKSQRVGVVVTATF